MISDPDWNSGTSVANHLNGGSDVSSENSFADATRNAVPETDTALARRGDSDTSDQGFLILEPPDDLRFSDISSDVGPTMTGPSLEPWNYHVEFPRFRGHALTEVERCSHATNKDPVPGGIPGANRRAA